MAVAGWHWAAFGARNAAIRATNWRQKFDETFTRTFSHSNSICYSDVQYIPMRWVLLFWTFDNTSMKVIFEKISFSTYIISTKASNTSPLLGRPPVKKVFARLFATKTLLRKNVDFGLLEVGQSCRWAPKLDWQLCILWRIKRKNSRIKKVICFWWASVWF